MRVVRTMRVVRWTARVVRRAARVVRWAARVVRHILPMPWVRRVSTNRTLRGGKFGRGGYGYWVYEEGPAGPGPTSWGILAVGGSGSGGGVKPEVRVIPTCDDEDVEAVVSDGRIMVW